MTKTSRIISLIAAALVFAACGADETILKSGKETPSSTNSADTAASSFEKDVEAMRTADFRFVYVLRRKDGGVIDAEDRSVIKVNTSDANRRVSSDGDKAFIIGTNAQIAPTNMMALYARFAVEDRSPQPPLPNSTPATANANK